MKKKYTSILLALIGLVGMVTAAKAETRGALKVTVPFEFVVDGRTLPAGTYTVSRLAAPRPLESRSNRRLFDIRHIQIILGEELDETGGDGGGIPARQVVARTRYRQRVDFWNPLLQ